MKARPFINAPMRDGIRLSSIMPADGWVAVTYCSKVPKAIITPLIGWALGDADTREGSELHDGQFVRGLFAGPPQRPIALVNEGCQYEGDPERWWEFMGYHPSVEAALKSIERFAPAGQYITVALPGGEEQPVTGTNTNLQAGSNPVIESEGKRRAVYFQAFNDALRMLDSYLPFRVNLAASIYVDRELRSWREAKDLVPGQAPPEHGIPPLKSSPLRAAPNRCPTWPRITWPKSAPVYWRRADGTPLDSARPPRPGRECAGVAVIDDRAREAIGAHQGLERAFARPAPSPGGCRLHEPDLRNRPHPSLRRCLPSPQRAPRNERRAARRGLEGASHVR